MLRKMLRKTIFALCAGAFLCATAAATTIARMNLRELAAASRVVVRARCTGNDSRWEGGEIWTFTRFETIEAFKGSPPGAFTVRLIGGQAGGIESIVAGVPRFFPGEEAILFLAPAGGGGYSVTAWEEGTFRVTRDAAGQPLVTQDMAAEEVYDRATRQIRNENIRRMPLSAFRRKILSITGRTAGHKQSGAFVPRFCPCARSGQGHVQRGAAIGTDSDGTRGGERAQVTAWRNGGAR
jgi:hypothetical protein